MEIFAPISSVFAESSSPTDRPKQNLIAISVDLVIQMNELGSEAHRIPLFRPPFSPYIFVCERSVDMRETMDGYISQEYAAARRREKMAKKAKETKQSEDSTARVSKEDEKRKTILAQEAIKQKKAGDDGGSVEEDAMCSCCSE